MIAVQKTESAAIRGLMKKGLPHRSPSMFDVTPTPQETYGSHLVSFVAPATQSVFGFVDGAASPTSSDERSDPATGDSFMTITGPSFLSLLKG